MKPKARRRKEGINLKACLIFNIYSVSRTSSVVGILKGEEGINMEHRPQYGECHLCHQTRHELTV